MISRTTLFYITPSISLHMSWLQLWQALYFFLPAYVANMTPVLVRKAPFLNRPIQEKLFGAHKTWRGLVLGTLAGTMVFWLQQIAYRQGFTELAFLDYAHISLAYGLLLSGGALLGDIIKSYYKRKENIPPGKSWIPWDQLDFVVGGIVGASFLYAPPFGMAMVLLIVSPLLHLVVNYLGYLLHLKPNKW